MFLILQRSYFLIGVMYLPRFYFDENVTSVFMVEAEDATKEFNLMFICLLGGMVNKVAVRST